jgi:hypothetical protein
MVTSLAAIAQGGGQAAAEGGHFEPFFPGLVVILPLLGFAINGFLALRHARASADAVRAGGELDLGDASSRPLTHTLPTWVGPGVMALAFLITLVNFTRMLGAHLEEPVVTHYWTWIYFAYLNLFVFFMLVLVTGSSYALMFVGWEGVGLCS